MNDRELRRSGFWPAAALTLAAACASGGALAQDLPVLKMVVPMGPQGVASTEAQAEVEAHINALIGPKIGAHVDLVQVPLADFNQRMTLMHSSREAYDIAMTAPWTNNFFTNVAQGNLMALDEYLDEVPELAAAVPAEVLSVGTLRGQLYGVPVQQLFPKSFGFNVKTELVEKYDIDLDAINGWADLTPVLERVVKGEGPGFYAFGGRIQGMPELWGYEPIVAGTANYAVVRMDDPTHTVVNLYDTEEYREVMRLRRAWHDAGLTDPNPMNREQVRAALAAGTHGFYVDASQDRPSDRVLGGAPASPKRFAPLVLTTPSMNASMMSVSADSANPVEALRLIALLHSDAQVFNAFAYGIEGRNWQFKADGSGLVEKVEGTGYWPDINWVWGKSWLALPQREIDLTAGEEAQATNAAATRSPLLGFSFDVAPVEQEVIALAAVVANFEAVESGRVADVDAYIDEQIAALEAAGLARVQEEIARQIAEWSAQQK
jgi:putative aldouronate transport system substrate-binding protein